MFEVNDKDNKKNFLKVQSDLCTGRNARQFKIQFTISNNKINLVVTGAMRLRFCEAKTCTNKINSN